MPTTAKTSGTLAKLGDLSTFDVSTAAVPLDTADSSGGIPTLSATFVDGTDTEYLVGDTLTLTSPSVGSYSGRIVSHSKSRGSNRHTVDTQSILSRLNSDHRLYPLPDYSLAGDGHPLIPLYSLEYWTQQCGIYYTKVPGDVLFYQSHYGHFGAFAKGITRPVRSTINVRESGGGIGVPAIFGGRTWGTFGTGYESLVTFPEGAYLPVAIPKMTDPNRMVFGLDVVLDGAGRVGHTTWSFVDNKGRKTAVRLLIKSDSGFELQVAETPDNYVTKITQAATVGSRYTVYFSLSQNAATSTRLHMVVLDAVGAVLSSQFSFPTSIINGSLSLTSVRYYGEMGGTGSQIAYANSFISLEKATPVTRFADVKSLTQGYKGARFMVGFSGNVWEHIKQYCSIYHLDVSYENGKLTFGPRQRDVKVGASLSELSTTVSEREQARTVEVVNQNHTPSGNSPSVLWKADSVYQVAVGEIQEFVVQTPHSILETSQPECVWGIEPYPYTVGAGQYVVTGSDGYIVSPDFWRDQGGSIKTETTENDGEIKVTIKGPDYDSPRAPYRISEGDAGRPALYVSGLGVLSKPETLKVATGNGRAAKDVGVTLDSPFIGDVEAAYDAAARAARAFATPEVRVSIAEPLLYDEISKLGTFPSGALVKHEGNIQRVVSASQSHSSMSGSAVQHNTIYQLKRSFGPGTTIAGMKAYYAGKSIGKVNIKPLKQVK